MVAACSSQKVFLSCHFALQTNKNNHKEADIWGRKTNLSKSHLSLFSYFLHLKKVNRWNVFEKGMNDIGIVSALL